jgi:archaellum component FlaC
MTGVDLTRSRLERLEKLQRETNDRLGRVEQSLGGVQDSLGRVVEGLEAHSQHSERMEGALTGIAEGFDGLGQRVERLGDRVDRLVTAIARGRTQDLARLDDHERRLRALERRNGKRRKRS